MTDETVLGRVLNLELRVENHDRALERVNSDIRDLRQLMTSFGERIDEKFDSVGDKLDVMRTDTLQSVPPWVVEAMARKSVIITILASASGVLVSAVIALGIAISR